MFYEKEVNKRTTREDMASFLEGWTFPPGIVDIVLSTTVVIDPEKLRKGLLLLARGDKPKAWDLVGSVLKAASPYVDEAISYPASKLLHSIKKNSWSELREMRTLEIVEYADILGVSQLEGLNGDEVRDLDRWLAIRAEHPGKITILMGDLGSAFKVTTGAYEGRITDMGK